MVLDCTDVNDYERGQWRSLNRVIAYINTHDEKSLCRKMLFRDLMEMRPLLDSALDEDYIDVEEDKS